MRGSNRRKHIIQCEEIEEIGNSEVGKGRVSACSVCGNVHGSKQAEVESEE